MLAVSACGWHLRGVTTLPLELQELHLISSADTEFNQKLIRDLRFNNVKIISKFNPSVTVLEIKNLKIERRELTVNAAGQIDEYQLDAYLDAELIVQSEHKSQTFNLKAQRFFTNDLSNQAGTRADEELQRSKLQQQLVNQLIAHLSKLQLKAHHDTAPRSTDPTTAN